MTASYARGNSAGSAALKVYRGARTGSAQTTA